MAVRLLSVIILLAAGLAGCESSDPPLPGEGDAPAGRIVSLAPNITELVYAAGAGKALAGVVEFSDYPAAALEVPRVGDSFRIDYEVVGALEPDLILAWESGNPPEVIARLRELGYRVVALETTDLDSIADQIQRIGALAGTSEQAAAAARDYRASIAALASGQHATRAPVSVFWQISAKPYFSVTSRHVINEVIELCGGRNVFAGLPGLAPPVALEAVLAERPQVIIAAAKDDGWRADWQQWPELPAVRDGRLYSIDPDLVSRSGPRLADGAAAVCAALAAAG